jgi:[ribosomal protein S18]-alanine N-acetyltransferase
MTVAQALTIRPVRGADLLRIAEIEEASFADPWPVELVAVELAHPQAILLAACRVGAPVAGYAAFRHVAGEAELLRLAVDPVERRQGLGQALVEAGLERLRKAGGIEVCHLEVRVDNHPAIAVYEALGFAPTGRRRGYYRDGTDALIYTKTL